MKKQLSALTLTLLLLLAALPLTAGAAAPSFVDVPEDHSAYDSIQYVCRNGLMNGVGNDCFAPESGFTRAMFVTILGRMEGVDPAAYPGSSFSDVSARSMAWAAPYIQWASENSIVNGVGAGKFDPNGIITREQYCAIVQRYFVSMEGTLSTAPPMYIPLSDGGDIRDYAKESVYALVGYGLIDLYPGREFLPQHRMSRAEITQTFSRVHALRTTGVIPRDLLTENTPPCLLFGLSARQMGNFSILRDWEPTYTEFDYWFSITHMGYAAIGFHSGYNGSDYLYQVDTTRADSFTSKGIAVGSTRAQVRAAYPLHLHDSEFAPFEGDYLWFNETSAEGYGWNLFFWFENDRVTRILAYNLFD